MTTLSETRLKDRKITALKLETFCDENGISHDRTANDSHQIRIKMIFPNDVRLSLDFTKNSWQPNTYVISWYMASDSERKFSRSKFFGVNTFHWQKATDVAYGFEELISILNDKLVVIKNGTAFAEAEEL